MVVDTITVRTFLGHEKTIRRDQLKWRPGAYAIVLHEDKVLLVKTVRTGQYVLPGGGVDLGERHAETLQRELREETGIVITVGEMISFMEDIWYYDPTDTAYHAQLFYYRCEPQTFDLIDNADVQDDEVEAPQWVAISSLSEDQFFYKPQFMLTLIQQVANGQSH